MKDRFLLALLLTALLLATGACGKKPSMVDPPEGVKKNEFPRPYPRPWL